MKKPTNAEKAQAAIRSLLYGASIEGLYQRQPDRFTQPPETAERVKYECQILDGLGISWSVQNNALTYVSDADTPKIWNKLYSNSLDALAREILAGGTA